MKKLVGLLLIGCLCLFTGAFALDHSVADDGPPVEQRIDIADVDALVGIVITYQISSTVPDQVRDVELIVVSVDRLAEADALLYEISNEINLEVNYWPDLHSYSFTADNERQEMYGNKQGTMGNVDIKRYALPNYPYKKGYLNHYHRCESVLIDLV